jgi:predicted nucleic acid-binding protein
LSDESANRWAEWESRNGEIIAPYLLRYEVTNALHRSRQGDQINEQQVAVAVNAIVAMPIRYILDDRIHFSALQLAERFFLSATYDAHYLAVAMHEGTEFWTADQRLFNSVSHRLNWVRLME